MSLRVHRFIVLISLILLTLSPRTDGQIPEGWEIVEITNTPTLFDGEPEINDRGQIVFTGSVGSSFADREIFVYDRGGLYRITDDGLFDEEPSLNN